MDYSVVKVINNNVILAKENYTGAQVILMSKGIGFNRKPNDIVSDSGDDNKIFKMWDSGEKIPGFKYDKCKLEKIVDDIAKQSHKEMGVDIQTLKKPLLDHIVFAIDRLSFGLPVDNPYQGEIAVLYRREYKIAKYSVSKIERELGIKIGDSEACLIALHINAAKKKHNVSLSINKLKVYKEIIGLINESLGESYSEDIGGLFLHIVNEYIIMLENGIKINMPIKEEVFKNMNSSYNIALRLKKKLDDVGIFIDDDYLAFITVDIEKITQPKFINN